MIKWGYIGGGMPGSIWSAEVFANSNFLKRPVDMNNNNPLPETSFEHLRQTNLGRLIEDLHFYFDNKALQYLHEAGFSDIKSADAHVMRTMRLEGSRVTDMAQQAGISKQAMSKLVSSFISRGYLSWVIDENDKRNRFACVTEAGQSLLASGISALQRAEQDVADVVGDSDLETLRQILLKIKQAKSIRTGKIAYRLQKRRV